MSSSDYENEANKSTNDKKFVNTNDYVLFGTPIELNEEELETGKKIMKMEDQVATDDKGRRRFHGAFTGGFSAGYFNSCGSEQGWAPSTFISSRSDRNKNDLQKPENFMDEEDFGEFGIAPKKYSAKSKFYDENKSIKSEIDQSMESHKVLRSMIPDDQLYNSLNIVRKATVGFDLMRKMGWKEGRGFGENVSIDKANSKDSKIYSCDLPAHLKKPVIQNIWIAPKEELFKIPTPKSNFFGIGYISLRIEASSLSSNKNNEEGSFKPTGIEKKGIKGTAYGIGVYDEYDENDNIYDGDTIENYDFSIEPTIQNTQPDTVVSSRRLWHNFIKPKSKTEYNLTQYNLPVLPEHYVPHPVLGKDVSNTYKPGNRVSYDSKLRSEIINDEKKDKLTDTSYRVDNTKQPKHKQPLSYDLQKKFTSSGVVSTNIVDMILQDKMSAAQTGMFGKLTRTVDIWLPSDVLCRRFNIVCSGNKNIDQKATNFQLEKKKTEIKTSIITNLPDRACSGPLSVLNPDYIKQVVQLPEDSVAVNTIDKLVVKLAKDSLKPIVDDKIDVSYDNAEKPSIDLFKAVFGDDSDDEIPNSLINKPFDSNITCGSKRFHETYENDIINKIKIV